MPASAPRAYQRLSRRTTARRVLPVSSERRTSITSGSSVANPACTTFASKYAARTAVRSRPPSNVRRVRS
jgi:hypothetical protein